LAVSPAYGRPVPAVPIPDRYFLLTGGVLRRISSKEDDFANQHD
jgi:hypothetical protein